MAIKSPAKIARVKKWLKALRSGKYTRTSSYLRRVNSENKPTGYCCLGVLCDVVDPKGWFKGDARAHKFSALLSYDGKDNSFISDKFLKSVGLTHEDGLSLASKNDSGKWTFDMIADEISRLTGVQG